MQRPATEVKLFLICHRIYEVKGALRQVFSKVSVSSNMSSNGGFNFFKRVPLPLTAAPRPYTKAIPEVVLNCGAPVCRFFVVGWPDGSYGGHLATLTTTGVLTVWEKEYRFKHLEIFTGAKDVVGGYALFPTPNRSIAYIVLQERTAGISIFSFNPNTTPFNLTKHPCTIPPHLGFARMIGKHDLFFIPSLQQNFGVLSAISIDTAIETDDPSGPSFLREDSSATMLTFVKLLQSAEGEEFFVYGSENGDINFCSFIRVFSELGTKQVVFIKWSVSVNVNNFLSSKTEKLEQERAGQCSHQAKSPYALGSSSNRLNISALEDLAIQNSEPVSPLLCDAPIQMDTVYVGTNTKTMFLISVDRIKKDVSIVGRKSLVNKGVHAMAVHPNGKMMIVGGWDSVLRIYSIPSVIPVATYQYHLGIILDVAFFNCFDPTKCKYSILAASDDGQVSVWIPSREFEIEEGA